MRTEISAYTGHGHHHRLRDPRSNEAMTLATRIAVNGGIVQQLGTPKEIYPPANLFVATFMGSPSMNLVDVEADSNGLITLKPAATKYNQTGLSAGRHTMGLRAEHLTEVAEGDSNVRFDAQIDVVEPAGSDTFVVSATGRRRVRRSYPG